MKFETKKNGKFLLSLSEEDVKEASQKYIERQISKEKNIKKFPQAILDAGGFRCTRTRVRVTWNWRQPFSLSVSCFEFDLESNNETTTNQIA